MKKYGNKILAILLTAVCLIGVLPLSVSAAYETVYVPPLASVTHNTRPSASMGGLVNGEGVYNSYTIPVPLDTQNGVTFNIDGLTYYRVILFLDANFTMLRSGNITNAQEFYFDSQQLQGVSYIVFGIASIEPVLTNVVVQQRVVEVVVGAQNLAHQERYEQIEVPDPPTPPSDTNIANDILTMWQQFLVQNLDALGLYYEELVVPIALIIGIPICISIIGTLLTLIGGKKR